MLSGYTLLCYRLKLSFHRLQHDVDYSDYILPICLPEANDANFSSVYPNENAMVAGWGWTNDGGAKGRSFFIP